MRNKKLRTKWVFEEGTLLLGDCLEHMRQMRDDSVDLVFGSPPYESARLYLENGEDLKIARNTEEWVAWMVEVFQESIRVCDGVVAYVVGHGKGATTWSGAPALLMADLIRAGINLRNPLWYKRHGIMGGGGRDWFRSDLEFIVCAGPRDLPWSDNVACGHPPKFGPGGQVSHRDKSGTRYNDKQRQKLKKLMEQEGITQREAVRRLKLPIKSASNSGPNGDTVTQKTYVPPEKSNPGNVIDCGTVGGGHLGSNIAYDNEAPFPEKLPRFFIKSLCPPGGTVYDPFGGSGTTLAVAIIEGRKFISSDLRLSQIKLMKRRIEQARDRRGFGI